MKAHIQGQGICVREVWVLRLLQKPTLIQAFDFFDKEFETTILNIFNVPKENKTWQLNKIQGDILWMKRGIFFKKMSNSEMENEIPELTRNY